MTKDQKRKNELLRLASKGGTDKDLVILDKIHELEDRFDERADEFKQEVEKLAESTPNIREILEAVKNKKWVDKYFPKFGIDYYTPQEIDNIVKGITNDVLDDVSRKLKQPKDGKTPTTKELTKLIKPLASKIIEERFSLATKSLSGSLEDRFLDYTASIDADKITESVIGKIIEQKLFEQKEETAQTIKNKLKELSQEELKETFKGLDIERLDRAIEILDQRTQYLINKPAPKVSGGGGGSPVGIEEQDGSPSVSEVALIKVTNDTLTDEGGGVASLNLGLTEDITSSLDIGSIEAGQTIPKNTNLTSLIKSLLLKTFYPTYVAPSGNLTCNIPANIESGTTQNNTLVVSFNRGSIVGDIVSGIWDAGATQDYRAGVVDYYIIDGTNTGTTNTKTISNYQVVDGNNTWSSTTYYKQGPQPKDSLGNDFETPLNAGTLTHSRTIVGRRRAFFGYSNSAGDSTDIRGLQDSLLNPVNGSQFTINIAQGATNVVFAYPATLRDVSSVLYVEGLNAEIKGVFTKSEFNVAGANNYSPISYKVFVYVPVEPFPSTATYKVTI